MEKSFWGYRYCVRREYLGEEVDDVTILAAGPRLNAETSLQVEIKNAATSFVSIPSPAEHRPLKATWLLDEDFEDFNDEDANNDVEIEELTYSPIGTSTSCPCR